MPGNVFLKLECNIFVSWLCVLHQGIQWILSSSLVSQLWWSWFLDLNLSLVSFNFGVTLLLQGHHLLWMDILLFSVIWCDHVQFIESLHFCLRCFTISVTHSHQPIMIKRVDVFARVTRSMCHCQANIMSSSMAPLLDWIARGTMTVHSLSKDPSLRTPSCLLLLLLVSIGALDWLTFEGNMQYTCSVAPYSIRRIRTYVCDRRH